MFIAQAASSIVPDSLGLARVPSSFVLEYAGAVVFFGALVGAAEIVSRYRDEPLRALQRVDSLGYILLNGLTSLAVFAIVVQNRTSIFPKMTTEWIALISGFSGVALLRSKFFTFRTVADEDVPVGIDAVVTAFLQVLDRRIDRAQAARRWPMAFRFFQDVDEQRFPHLTAFLETNLRSYQNVSREELRTFGEAMKQLKAAADIPASLRAVTAGLALQSIVGSENFSDVARTFRVQQGLPAIEEGPLFLAWFSRRAATPSVPPAAARPPAQTEQAR